MIVIKRLADFMQGWDSCDQSLISGIKNVWNDAINRSPIEGDPGEVFWRSTNGTAIVIACMVCNDAIRDTILTAGQTRAFLDIVAAVKVKMTRKVSSLSVVHQYLQHAPLKNEWGEAENPDTDIPFDDDPAF